MSAPTCTPEIAEQILNRMSDGEFVQDLCKEFGTTVMAFWRLRQRSAEHREAYARARELQAAAVARNGYQRAWNAEDAQLDRLAYDAAKWMASKLDPANFGDKVQHTGADGQGPVAFVMYGEPEKADTDTWAQANQPPP